MKIGIVGCAGRMGRMLLKEVSASPEATLVGGIERPGSPATGTDLGLLIGGETLGIGVGDDAAELFAASDTVIDFTTPAATVTHAALAARHGSALIVGTTGMGPDHVAALERAAQKVPVVFAPNMSVGVTLLMALTERVAGLLKDDYDIEILEMHHRFKVDAPSGTALGLGKAAAAGRGVDLDEMATRVRDGLTGPREPGSIGFATLRGGDVVGDHTVIFAAEGERIELTHRASNRAVFAKGALRAALWTRDRAPGLYSMHDVLGL
ncbi:4-hydroxy-tetrahydrodipicolinate reductase [Rhodospirillum rubrum]|uniref:4-hydroxy-tetrahydrodipicolinate reductase n=1 Tax=Rhodospirillum rubrum TaxID=1085 RepID=UPI0019064A88|nr:4-hydroxy-tetrahydrodipicolinate reductase [Rhodospirillum rubrum]MBK1665494.1 4-hydroxy-tetrahydrodipicolinate reductase [Rhodospirillum rubrum]MBK1678372.1 4-hydroxy-tetrahydrodipicolinate reductase [Rhodospirillum rubrum]